MFAQYEQLRVESGYSVDDVGTQKLHGFLLVLCAHLVPAREAIVRCSHFDHVCRVLFVKPCTHPLDADRVRPVCQAYRDDAQLVTMLRMPCQSHSLTAGMSGEVGVIPGHELRACPYCPCAEVMAAMCVALVERVEGPDPVEPAISLFDVGPPVVLVQVVLRPRASS